MMDTVSKEKRSSIMKAVRGKDTKLEIELRKKLSQKGVRYRKNYNKVFGKPDIALPGKKISIFVDSCFWHGCKRHCRMPHSNRAYWNAKIRRNKERDGEVNKWHKRNEWKIVRFWEHELLGKGIDRCVMKIIKIAR